MASNYFTGHYPEEIEYRCSGADPQLFLEPLLQFPGSPVVQYLQPDPQYVQLRSAPELAIVPLRSA